MTKTPAKSPQAKRPVAGPRVAVVGGGMAGLTSALKLAERGYAVTVFEASGILGGNMSSTLDTETGVYHDVYPHMFCEWYDNFWALLKDDLKIDREAKFERRWSVKSLNKPGMTTEPDVEVPITSVAVAGKLDVPMAKYLDLKSPSTLPAIWDNLTSGVMSPANMFLFGFSMLDMAGRPKYGTNDSLNNQIDVNAFMYSRGYFNDDIAQLQDYFLKVVWSVPSSVTSTLSYQDFIKHTFTFPKPTPFSWLLKGSLQQEMIAPFEAALEAAHCTVLTNRTVREVCLRDQGVSLGFDGDQNEDYDFVILALPGLELVKLVLSGPPGQRIVERVPELAQIRFTWGEAIPVIDLYLKTKIADIPKEVVGLVDSPYALSFLDISQLWPVDQLKSRGTVLSLAASKGGAIPASNEHEQGFLMIKELREFVTSFDPGRFWGDPDSDIDWEKTAFRSNSTYLLFVNDVPSLDWRPSTTYANLPNVAFAGDICRTDVNMATIEAAVQSGLMAAQAVQSSMPRGQPIKLVDHVVYSDMALLATKLVYLPAAYAAAAWAMNHTSQRLGADTSRYAAKFSPQAYSLLLPVYLLMDCLITSYWLTDSIVHPRRGEGFEPHDDADTPLGFGTLLLGTAKEVMRTILNHLPDGEASRPRPGPSGTTGAFADDAWRLAKSAYPRGKTASATAQDVARPYRRRWRAKM